MAKLSFFGSVHCRDYVYILTSLKGCLVEGN